MKERAFVWTADHRGELAMEGLRDGGRREGGTCERHQGSPDREATKIVMR